MDFKRIIQKASATLLLSMLCLFAYAQKSVTLTVVDDLGEPMIGVSALVKGTSNGQVSDLDGKIRLNNVKPSDVIEVSYMGFVTQNVKVGNKNVISVTLREDTEALDEVVVVGYGAVKKSDLTGSIATIDTEKLLAKGLPSVMENLQGTIPGVNITQSSSRAGGGFDFEIRGMTTMSGNTSPLYVVDGVVCDDINFLNPQDIEQIDVLKDASSTAIYGSRATNGVVIVTTKSAKTQGGRESKPVISYDGYYGVTTAARMPEFMSPEEFAQFRHFRYLNPINVETNAIVPYGASNNWGMTSGNYATAWLTYDDSPQNDSYMKDLMKNGKTTDWMDEVMRNTAAQQNHYLSVSGNSGKSNYHFGIGYQSEEGIYKNDDMQRFNLKGAVDTQINNYLTAGFSVNAAHTDHTTVDNSAISNAFRLNEFCKAYDEKGELIIQPGHASGLDKGGSAQFTSTRNPLLDFENSEYNNSSWQALANFYVQIKPLKDLSLKSTFSPKLYTTRNAQFEGSNTAARSGADSRASVDNITNFSWTWDNQIDYALTLGDHKINLMGLMSASSFYQENYFQEAFGVVEAAKWHNLKQASGTAYTSSSAYTEWSMLSYAARLNYNYKDRYLLTATMRWDGSSRFADGHRWGAFPSVALAWRINQEEFMKNTSDWLSNLKLRVSYGETGNNNVSNYATSVTATGGEYYYGFADATGVNVYYPSGIANRLLSWETTREINLGLDFGFLNGRISGSIDWYNKVSSDLLLQRQLPYEAGGATLYDNVAEVKNTGVEISLTTVNVQNKDWNWTTSFTFAHNKNELLETSSGKVDDIENNWFIGESLTALYNYTWDGIVSDKTMTVPNTQVAQDKGFTPGEQVLSRDYYYACYGWGEGMPIIKDHNGDGVIDSNDKSIVGKTNPTWTGSINSTLCYKNWDFSFSIYTKQDYEVYSAFHGQYTPYGDRGMQHMAMDFYIPDGTLLGCDGFDENNMPINPVYQEGTHYGKYPFPTNESATNAGVGTFLAGNNAKSTGGYPYEIVDGSYWKVKNISLGYTFPKSMLKKTKIIKSLRLYFNVTNPFVFTDYDGFDPEWCGSGLSDGGPSTVTYQFGGSIKF